MSTIKVNTITKRTGSTLTLGEAGTTVTIASGATTSGMGRTGTVNWQTTPKTATFTAVSGEGYFCNTAGGTFEVDLPAGSAGAIVSVQDYNNTFDSNALRVDPNGTEKINGGAAGGFISLSTEGLGLTFVYIDATVGWRSVQSNEYSTSGSNPTFVQASGGNAIVTCGNFKTHIFTGPGTFAVSAVGSPDGSNSIDYLVVAGGGGGGTVSGGTGGGAGGFRVSNSYSIPAPTMSPLSNPTGLPVSAQSYSIAIGAGGAGGALPSNDGVNGSVSSFSSISSAGGGKGRGPGNGTGYAGGSGSGGKGAPPGGPTSNGFAGGAGNTPPVSPSQGNNGGKGFDGFSQSTNGGGGGGAGAGGSNAGSSTGGAGGAGSFISNGFINPTSPSYGTPGPVGSTRYFAGGGGGTTCGGPGGQPVTFGVGGAGGGGAGAAANSSTGVSGTANTGGSGGGGIGNPASPAGAGGSGIVMIRYKFQQVLNYDKYN